MQRISRRDKKAFLGDQCKEIEQNNKMVKTRDLFKKIRDTNGKLHSKMGTIKYSNCMDLIESQQWESPVGCRLWGRTESDTTEATLQQQQQGN